MDDAAICDRKGSAEALVHKPFNERAKVRCDGGPVGCARPGRHGAKRVEAETDVRRVGGDTAFLDDRRKIGRRVLSASGLSCSSMEIPASGRIPSNILPREALSKEMP